jgi:hypothetical protein
MERYFLGQLEVRRDTVMVRIRNVFCDGTNTESCSIIHTVMMQTVTAAI